MLTDDNVIASADAKQLVAWNPYDQNGKASFFDPEWMFGIKEGFDVVIGNPPYIQLQENEGRLAELYKDCGFDTFDRGGDIYCLFYERGWNMLKRGGLLCYITSSKWMRAGYGERLRRFLTSKANPEILIDFNETHVFESACVMTNILAFQKQSNSKCLRGIQTQDDFNDPSGIASYFAGHAVACEFNGGESWVVRSDFEMDLKNKVETQGVLLKDWNVDINYGIKTGYNPAFFITTRQREEILESCISVDERKLTESIIRPLLRGKDIRKYGNAWSKSQLWIINTHNGVRNNFAPIDIKKYPAIKKHLDKYYGRLEKRLDKGITPYNLRNCAYINQFDIPKVMYPEITKYMPFMYDESGFIMANTGYILTGKHISYLVAFLNSSLFKYCFRENFQALFGGARRMLKMYIEKIPVKEVSDKVDAEFRTLVLDIQENYSDEKARAIDQKIFDLYGLTPAERETIGYIDIK